LARVIARWQEPVVDGVFDTSSQISVTDLQP